MALDEPQADDEKIDVSGITWLVAKADAPAITSGDGVRIDHTAGVFGAGFAIEKR